MQTPPGFIVLLIFNKPHLFGLPQEFLNFSTFNWFFQKCVFTLQYKVLLNYYFLYKSIAMILQNKRLVGILITVAIILLIPLVAMQFTDEVKWSPFDFAVMGVLLLSTGLLCEFVMKKFSSFKHRVIICGIILVALLLIWAELAVGIFGTPFAGS
jgi:hypothetical protein